MSKYQYFEHKTINTICNDCDNCNEEYYCEIQDSYISPLGFCVKHSALNMDINTLYKTKFQIDYQKYREL